MKDFPRIKKAYELNGIDFFGFEFIFLVFELLDEKDSTAHRNEKKNKSS